MEKSFIQSCTHIFVLSYFITTQSVLEDTLQDKSHLMGKPTMWFSNRSDTNRAAQSQKMVRGLKFWSQVEEESYYPSSENKGADQLRGYREADLRLCFRICRLLVFPWGSSNITTLVKMFNSNPDNFKIV